MRRLIALSPLLVGAALFAGGCATVEEVKHAQDTAAQATMISQSAQNDARLVTEKADQASQAAQNALNAAQTAQQTAQSAQQTAQTAQATAQAATQTANAATEQARQVASRPPPTVVARGERG
jgi:preprotein translocase subunit SecD